MEKERIEILLKEYEICEQDSNSASANNWTVIGIFSSVSVGALAAIIFKLMDNQSSNYTWQSLLFVIILGVMALIILNFLKSWTQRVTSTLGYNNKRMREIEKLLGMSKNLKIWELDDWDDMPQKTKEQIVNSWELLCSKCENKERCKKTEEECNIYKKDLASRVKQDLPEGLKPPDTGRNILNRFFCSLFALWSVTILYTLGLLIFKLVDC